MAANTLGLDDDLDGVEVVQSLEKAFDLKFTDEEVERVLTVGEFHDLLISKIPTNASDRKCATAMAFYRLRKAMKDFGSDGLKPSSDISFLERKGVKRSFKLIEQRSDLRLPTAGMDRVGFTGCALMAIAILSLLVGMLLYWHFLSFPVGICAAAVAVGYLLVRFDPGKLPKDCVTLGDLARRTAALSYGRLVRGGASHREEDVWNTLLDLLSGYALPRAEINRDTFFLQSQLKKAREKAA